MSKTKELVICILAIIALILSISTNVFATTTDFNALLQNMNTNQSYQTIPDNSGANLGIIDLNNNNATQNNVTSGNTTLSNVTPNTTPTTNNSNNTTNTIPYTGVNNFSIIAIIAVCGILAVYAYKKIRDYNA